MDASDSGHLAAYRGRIESFVETELRPYLNRLDQRDQRIASPKEFNDPVWGTIVLDGAEVVVLDSPLLQRLRRIRQLGVAQLVYPGANHTRLEHSIGVCHQVQRLVASTSIHSPDGAKIDDDWAATLRMAGLCHDVGHGLMSHVIENAVQFDDACIDLGLDFQEWLGKDSRSQLSEIAAFYMVRSPAFEELLKRAREIAELKPMPRLAENMAACIIGQSSDENYPLIHEIISGPFDCDKLDYMARDAIMCGVPVVTDVNRLVQKIRAVSVRTDRLPAGIAARVAEKGGSHIVVAVARSGASTLHEVSLSRSLMHDKVYRHHKVRAAEAMVAAIVAQVGEGIEPYTPMLPFTLADDEFFGLDNARLAALDIEGGDADLRVKIASDLTRRLRDRDLFVRAFAFSQKMPNDDYKGDLEQHAAVENLIRAAAERGGRQELARAIADRVRDVADAIGATDLVDALPGGDAYPYIWIDPPTSSSRTDTDAVQHRAYLVDQGNNLAQMSTVSAETRGWADAYINTRDVGYIFCPLAIAELVHVATEIVLRVERSITIPREMLSYTKVQGDRIARIRDELAREGYYSELPLDLRPDPESLRSAGIGMRIDQLVRKLGHYRGPTVQPGEQKIDGGALSAGRIRDWIAQFDEGDTELALKTLEGIQVLDREKLNLALEEFLAIPGNEVFKEGSLVPIGEPKDGSAIMTYFSGDMAVKYPVRVRSVPDALATEGPLVFVDDIIQRGGSVISIFEAMLDLPDTQGLNEERGAPLIEPMREILRARDIAIVVSAGLAQGVDNVQQTLSGYGLKVKVHARLHDDDLPTLRAALSAEGNPAQVEAFINKCRAIGMDLLADVPDDKREQRALGYGNHGLLVISTFNTPTASLTALWRPGKVRGAEWRPLVPRRKKT